MEISIKTKTLSLITGDIFAMAKDYDSLFLFVHKGFNAMSCHFENFLKTSPSRVWLIGVDEKKYQMSDVENVVMKALDEMAKRKAKRLAMSVFYTTGDDHDNYVAQGRMINACMSWLDNSSSSSIECIALIDRNSNENFETALFDFMDLLSVDNIQELQSLGIVKVKE